MIRAGMCNIHADDDVHLHNCMTFYTVSATHLTRQHSVGREM